MLEIIRDAASYVIAISILVAFHEFGHFWVARRLGIKVLRYSIGFGKPLWQRVARDGVSYQIGSIPLGGYVKLLDEREGEVAEADLPHAFNRQPVAARIAVYAAGPAFNFLLAIAFFWLLFVIGIPDIKPVVAEPPALTVAARAGLHDGDTVRRLDGIPIRTWMQLRGELIDKALAHREIEAEVLGRDGQARQVWLDFTHVRADPQRAFEDIGLEVYEPPVPAVIGVVQPDSAASRAGLVAGDRLTAVAGTPVSTFKAMRGLIVTHPGETLRIDYERAGQAASAEVTLGARKEGDRTIGLLGAQSRSDADDKLWQDLRAELRLDPLAALPAAAGETWDWCKRTLQLLGRMLVGEISVQNVSGPIQIAQAAGFTAAQGFVSFVSFLAMVSVSLGVFNLLPVPVLDGGQILFALIEVVKGSPLSERLQLIGQQLGLAILALLMSVAIYNDVAHSFG